MSSTTAHRIGVVQMTACGDQEANLRKCERMIKVCMRVLHQWQKRTIGCKSADGRAAHRSVDTCPLESDSSPASWLSCTRRLR